MNELWKDVVGYEGAYEISSIGRVKSLARFCRCREWQRPLRERILLTNRHRDGHILVELNHQGKAKKFYVHALVLEAFVGPRPPGMECRHLNGKPWDNRCENLKWGTNEENKADMVRHGTDPIGERHGCAKLSDLDVRKIDAMYETGKWTARKLGAVFGVSKTCVLFIAKGKSRWTATGKPRWFKKMDVAA